MPVWDVGVGGDERAARFTHFRAVHGQKPWANTLVGDAVTGEFQGLPGQNSVWK